MRTFDLLLGDGTVARWNGEDGPTAAANYVAEHSGVSVVAWRVPRYPVTVLGYAGKIEG
jgi:hypothetical protein